MCVACFEPDVYTRPPLNSTTERLLSRRGTRSLAPVISKATYSIRGNSTNSLYFYPWKNGSPLVCSLRDGRILKGKGWRKLHPAKYTLSLFHTLAVLLSIFNPRNWKWVLSYKQEEYARE